MVVTQNVLEAVVDILLGFQEESSLALLRKFDEVVIALSIDSGSSIQQVQSQLVEKMLLDPRHTAISDNIIRLDDYLHLIKENDTLESKLVDNKK